MTYPFDPTVHNTSAFDPEVLITDFIQVAALADFLISRDDIELECLPAPHKSPKLPQGKMAVYVFMMPHRCLKVGKVGSGSNARFSNHHYLPKASKSNLAASILKHVASAGELQTLTISFDTKCSSITDINVGQWLRANAARYHFYLSDDQPMLLLNLLETFVQCRLKPMFEGQGTSG